MTGVPICISKKHLCLDSNLNILSITHASIFLHNTEEKKVKVTLLKKKHKKLN